MADADVTLCVMASALTRSLLDGEVTVKGTRVHARQGESIDNNSRRMLNLEFDVAEMSIATYTKARPDGRRPLGLRHQRQPQALEAFVETATDQKLVGRRFAVDEMFAPNLPDDFR